MADGTGCPDGDRLVALALSQATAAERAALGDHLAACPSCRGEVEALAGAVGAVLPAAAGADPPEGFTSSVLAALRGDPRRARPRRRAAVVAAVAVVAALVGFVAGTTLTRSPPGVREAAMVTPDGDVVGRLWAYPGRPGWVVVSVPGWAGPDADGDTYLVRAGLDDGRVVDLGTARPADGVVWSTVPEVDPARIRTVTLLDPRGRPWCRAEL